LIKIFCIHTSLNSENSSSVIEWKIWKFILNLYEITILEAKVI